MYGVPLPSPLATPRCSRCVRIDSCKTERAGREPPVNTDQRIVDTQFPAQAPNLVDHGLWQWAEDQGGQQHDLHDAGPERKVS